MKRRSHVALILAITALGSCKPTASDESAIATTALVRIEIAAPHPMSQTLEVYGTADYAPQSQRIVDATAEVVVEEVLVAAGQAVAADQPLLRIRSTANSTLELQRARNDSAAADQELSRTQHLFSQRLATNADMTVAKQSAANARANRESTAARIGKSGSRTITSDRALTVTSVDVARGDIVAADTPLLHLASSDALSVRLGIEPADLRLVRPGQAVEIRPVYDAQTSIFGTVSEVVRQVDTQTRLIQAIVTLPGAGQLLPGSTVRGLIEVQHRPAILSVPRAAILRDQDKTFLFIAIAQKAKRLEVKVGQDDGTRIEVIGGLAAGDAVVVEGNYELQDGMAIALDGKVAPP